MNTIDITPIVNAAIALIGAGVSVFLIPWLKSQTTEAQRKELTAWVKIGVAAAEQLYKGAGRGEEKKQYVIDFLKQKGFKVRRGKRQQRDRGSSQAAQHRGPDYRMTERGGLRPALFLFTAKEVKL